jgi:tetratricopeptide (TPR) repeat protein
VRIAKALEHPAEAEFKPQRFFRRGSCPGAIRRPTNMKLFTLTAAGLAALAAPGVANAQAYSTTPPPHNQPGGEAAAQGQMPKVSAKAKGAIGALQKAVNANDKANIPALMAAAQAAAQTNDDRWFIGELQLKAAIAANDRNAMANAADAIVATGIPTPQRASQLYKGIASDLYNAKDYAAAAALFDKASKADPTDTEALTLLGQSMLLGGRPADAVAVMQRAIQASSTGGRKADENLYRIAVQAAFEGKSPQAPDIARQWLVAYPSPDSWRNTLIIYRNSAQLDDEGILALLRLLNATGGLKNAADYNTYIKGLIVQSNFNEAHAVLEQAIAAKAIDAGSADAAAVTSKPTASAADLAAAAKTAPNGSSLFKIANRYYGIGDYAQAAELYRQTKARGVDAPTADLYAGMALARAGDKAGAKTLLSAVTGPRAGIAQYWLLYLDQHR